jgi:hypothetical protein
MSRHEKSKQDQLAKAILIIGVPLVLFIFFCIAALSITGTRIDEEQLKGFVIFFGGGISIFIFLALLFAILVRRNIHG